MNCVVLFSFANGIKHIFIICELFFAEYELDFEKLLIRYPDADFVGGYVSLAKIFLRRKISSNSIKIWHFWPKKRYKRFWNFKILSFRKDYSQKEKQICEKIYALCQLDIFEITCVSISAGIPMQYVGECNLIRESVWFPNTGYWKQFSFESYT